MQLPPLNTTLIASNALSQDANKLNNISQSINHSLVENNQSVNNHIDSASNYSALSNIQSNDIQSDNSQSMNNSLETNLIGLSRTKDQMLAIMKVLEVQNKLDQPLGKAFDGWS